jgi:hypothetical protein
LSSSASKYLLNCREIYIGALDMSSKETFFDKKGHVE